MEFARLVTPPTPHPAVPTLRDVEEAGNTSDVDVDQQLLSESAGSDCLLKVPLSNGALADVPVPDVPPPDVPVPVAPLSGVHPDGSVGEE
jgi:hypothetical protein